jgi:ATP-dependent protease ClpP protease subunit
MEDIYLNKMLEWESNKSVSYLTKSLETITNSLKNEEPISYSFSRKKDVRKEEYRKILREYLNFDTILTPEETISIGLCDEIYSSSLI